VSARSSDALILPAAGEKGQQVKELKRREQTIDGKDWFLSLPCQISIWHFILS
jgi:hypothetical protein